MSQALGERFKQLKVTQHLGSGITWRFWMMQMLDSAGAKPVHLHMASSRGLVPSQHGWQPQVIGPANGDSRFQKWASQWIRQKVHCPYDLVGEVTEHRFCQILSEEAIASLFRFKTGKIDPSVNGRSHWIFWPFFFFFNTAGYKGPRKV